MAVNVLWVATQHYKYLSGITKVMEFIAVSVPTAAVPIAIGCPPDRGGKRINSGLSARAVRLYKLYKIQPNLFAHWSVCPAY